MQADPLQRSPPPQSSNAIATNSDASFVETLEYKRFIEFCDACRQYRYIGLCFGPPGVGKTLSALRYSRNEILAQADPWSAGLEDSPPFDTLFYTPSVMNSPSRIASELRRTRETIAGLARRPLRREAQAALAVLRTRDDTHRKTELEKPPHTRTEVSSLKPTYLEVFQRYAEQEKALIEPTTLILIDESDRLRMTSLEQIRAIFDEGGAGLILIGMPGIEKRMARFPQFYSRIGFVHEFRPLGTSEMQALLGEHWAPSGVHLPKEPMSAEVTAAIIRMTAGNFRLLNRLLAQIERILDVNGLAIITTEVVMAARERLVIGQA
jgi:DNA transposition AAA+ family ATPase